jgi:hypothetical protein
MGTNIYAQTSKNEIINLDDYSLYNLENMDLLRIDKLSEYEESRLEAEVQAKRIREEEIKAAEEEKRKQVVSNRMDYLASIPKGKMPTTLDYKLGDKVYIYFTKWENPTIDDYVVYVSEVVEISKDVDGTWSTKDALIRKYVGSAGNFNLRLLGYFESKYNADESLNGYKLNLMGQGAEIKELKLKEQENVKNDEVQKKDEKNINNANFWKD